VPKHHTIEQYQGKKYQETTGNNLAYVLAVKHLGLVLTAKITRFCCKKFNPNDLSQKTATFVTQKATIQPKTIIMEFLGFSVLTIAKILFAAFNGILFTQSGLDKVFNYQGNLAYFQGHFKNSPLASSVPLLTPIITLLETSAGVASLAGGVLMLVGAELGPTLSAWGMLLGAKSLVALFLGQRLAKDYAGAAALVPYFLMAMAGLVLWAF
jgi:hypothetical protein